MPNYAVRVDSISKYYKTGDITVRAVENVSFALAKGEFAAIVGPSGSGKSSLMNILGTIDKPTKGEVFIDNIETSKMTGNELADFRNRKLGFIFQSFNLINGLDAQKNVELPLLVTSVPEKERKDRAQQFLVQLGLKDRFHLKPTQLSGGEQQRVAIARALVVNPALLLADEPTGNLDSKSGEAVVKLLRKICDDNNVTIIMITHNLDTTKYCDRVIHIKDGKLEKNEVIK